MPATSPIVRALRAAHLHDAPRAELLQLACDRLRSLGAPYTSVYAYMLQDGGTELVLEAFSGRETEHTRIAGRHAAHALADRNPGMLRLPSRKRLEHQLGPTVLQHVGVDGRVRRAQAAQPVAGELQQRRSRCVVQVRGA